MVMEVVRAAIGRKFFGIIQLLKRLVGKISWLHLVL